MGKDVMKRFLLIAVASIAVAAPLSPAFAQIPTAIAPGMQVTDAKGGAIGTVTAVNGDVVTIKTDRLEANLDRSSFTASEGKLLMGMTQAELNGAIEKDQAAAEASLAVGSPVKGSAGAQVGTIEAIDAEFVTIKLTSGKSVRLPRTGIRGSASGAVIGLSQADLETQLGATAEPQPEPETKPNPQ